MTKTEHQVQLLQLAAMHIGVLDHLVRGEIMASASGITNFKLLSLVERRSFIAQQIEAKLKEEGKLIPDDQPDFERS